MQQHYQTSDINFAAFLSLKGYTMAGAVPVEDNSGRLVFHLFWTRETPFDVAADIVKQMEEYNVGRYQQFANKLKMCRMSLRSPITRQELLNDPRNGV